jgi:hypothetical protein
MRIPEQHRAECGSCYGNGCFVCGNRGWSESDEGREAREYAEERRWEEQRDLRREDD